MNVWTPSHRRKPALSVVVALALSAACIGKSRGPSSPEAADEISYDQSGNPLPPEGQDPSGAPAPAVVPAAPTDRPGTIVVIDDGTCWFHATIECPPKTPCNPPPAMQVRCAPATQPTSPPATQPTSPTSPTSPTRTPGQ